MAAVAARHGGRLGDRHALGVTAFVTGHASVLREDLHHVRASAHVEDTTHQVVGDAVEITINLQVVVETHLGLGPGGEVVTRGGQRAKRRLVDLGKQQSARALHLLEGSLVDHLHQLTNAFVERPERREALLAQAHDDPALCNLHRDFDLGLVAGFVGSRRNDHDAVVLGHFLVGGVDVRFVAVRLRDARAQVVGHANRGAAPVGFEGVLVGVAPVHELLAAQRLGVEVAGRTEHRDEQLSLKTDGEITLVVDGNGESGKVDEHLLAGLVVLAHRHVELLAPVAIELAELAVLVTVGVELFVLDPEQHERHALLGELLLYHRVVGFGANSRGTRGRAEQPGLERVVIAQFLGQRP